MIGRDPLERSLKSISKSMDRREDFIGCALSPLSRSSRIHTRSRSRLPDQTCRNPRNLRDRDVIIQEIQQSQNDLPWMRPRSSVGMLLTDVDNSWVISIWAATSDKSWPNPQQIVNSLY